MSTRAFIADKFAPVWLAVRTLIQGHTQTHNHTLVKILWQCTEHGRLWSDPMEADARKVDFGRETKKRSFVMPHDKIEPLIWERS